MDRTSGLVAAGGAVVAALLALVRRGARKPKPPVGPAGLTKAEVISLRSKHFCSAQSVSYANTDPLWIVRGQGVYLYDEKGTKYLDTRNNVGHLGHSHPAVVQAVQDQIQVLNTNSRYLHHNLVQLAVNLTSTLPPTLCKCFFVNSGSEANDLAIRLARCHTGNTDMIVVDRGYHGHTVEGIKISPYKYEHYSQSKGAQPVKAEWVHKVPCPDDYRAEQGSGCTRKDPAAGPLFAESVAKACDTGVIRGDGDCTHTGEAAGGKVAALFIESGMSVAGVILPPDGYLKNAYKSVHEAGGVCVADEVQVGLGRLGKYFWGFEQQGVVPDIVTIGKPFGNGMPLAAVVTTEAIAASFASTGMEYFNTFGGNPVVAAAGLAVLETIEKEGLQAKAEAVGTHIFKRLQSELIPKHELIGDVRGSGLFLGIEFVRDKMDKTPATVETSMICSRLKDDFNILTSIDGPHNNVIVMKPPLCFSTGNADEMLNALDQVLSALPKDIDASSNIGHTPT